MARPLCRPVACIVAYSAWRSNKKIKSRTPCGCIARVWIHVCFDVTLLSEDENEGSRERGITMYLICSPWTSTSEWCRGFRWPCTTYQPLRWISEIPLFLPAVLWKSLCLQQMDRTVEIKIEKNTNIHEHCDSVFPISQYAWYIHCEQECFVWNQASLFLNLYL